MTEKETEKPRKHPSHYMIAGAVGAMKERSGSSRDSIINLKENYKVLVGIVKIPYMLCAIDQCCVGVVNEIPTDKQLWTLSEHLAGRWKHVARSLDVNESTIEQVGNDLKGDGREQAYQMLLAWKEKLSQSASIGVLCKALRDERLTSVAGKVFCLSDNLINEL
eukprot:m.212045 g.212045  ORF g.212045 m.212045 type:complete len:164 (+) comp39768_c1_seq9:107-598(+)